MNWINYVGNEASYPWINDYVSGTGFDIQTDDAATYADPASAQTVFNCRVVASDPDSTSPTGTVYGLFDISLSSVCENDQISITPANLMSDSSVLVSSTSTTDTTKRTTTTYQATRLTATLWASA